MASSKTEIIVARHGETHWNNQGKWQGSTDIPLNRNGEEQARELAHRLKGEGIKCIYSSDLSRAKSTAGSVKELTNADGIFEDPRLRERNLGEFEGWSLTEVAKYMKMTEEESHILDTDELLVDRLPTVESWGDFTYRVWVALNEIAERKEGEKILVVAHGGVLRAITMALASEGPKVDFGNTEFVRICFSGGKWNLVQS